MDVKTYLGISNILNNFLPISLEVGLGFGLGLDITNSKKSKKIENFHMTSFYMTYHLKKIINMTYGGFYKKNLHRNELRGIKMYGFLLKQDRV